MAKHLQELYSAPLEREFESWIVSGIERYFKALGMDYAIWAVSPSKEVTWPADEQLLIDSKIVGIQFKQAKIPDEVPDPGPDRLKWVLHQPRGQFELVQRHPEIFYCLPTFINRALREEALQHCMFWRPGKEVNKNVWYDNSNAPTPYNCVIDSMRWGRFVEGILHCTIGKLVRTSNEALGFMQTIVDTYREFIPTPNQSIESYRRAQREFVLYWLVVKHGGEESKGHFSHRG